MCGGILKPVERAAQIGSRAIDSIVAAPGDLLDSAESTLKSLKPKMKPDGTIAGQAAGDQSAPTVFFADPTQAANSATAVQRRKPRSLLSAAGAGDTSTANTAVTMAKATLGA